MEFIVLFLAICAVVLIVQLFVRKRRKLPFSRKKKFLEPAEIRFFKILEKAVRDQYYVFPQVHLPSLISADRAEFDYYKYQDKIENNSADYVIADKNTLQPKLAVMLETSQQKVDDFLEIAFKDAKFPLLKIKSEKSYEEQEISELINNLIETKPEA